MSSDLKMGLRQMFSEECGPALKTNLFCCPSDSISLNSEGQVPWAGECERPSRPLRPKVQAHPEGPGDPILSRLKFSFETYLVFGAFESLMTPYRYD